MRARVEHSEVEGVLGHLKGVIFACDVARINSAGKVEEDVGADDSEGSQSTVEGAEQRPGTREEHVLAAGEQGEEEDYDCGVAIVEHVVAEALEGVGEAAAGEDAVKREEAGGDARPYGVV